MNWIPDRRNSLRAAAALNAAAILCSGGFLNRNLLCSALLSVALLAM
ncbi:MAG TPA: hypothetical protein VML19_31055 [Verrucomicrobiae bacterium]|nr:hypothetical protein [Verrucomicrobiae bacterium]